MPVDRNALPLGLTEDDLKYPDFNSGDHVIRDGTIQIYQVKGRDGGTWWAIATLSIGGRPRGGKAQRTYAIRTDNEKGYRIGGGPHVLRNETVYIRESRKVALAKLIELHHKGEVESNQIRDRISSRRAQGQLERAKGNRYWLWNK